MQATVPRCSSTSLGETGPLSQGVQARRKALRIPHIHGMEVRKKRPRGFKKEAQGVQVSPLNPLSVSPWHELLDRPALTDDGGSGRQRPPLGHREQPVEIPAAQPVRLSRGSWSHSDAP